jgi:hypothetical protein
MYHVHYKFGSGINPICDSIFYETKTQKSYFPAEFNEQARLFYLCKIWGFVKYYGENPALFPLLDSLLISAIPQTINATNKPEYAEVLKSFITPALDLIRQAETLILILTIIY